MALSPRFVEAVRYAFELHIRQTRKGTAVPYISHLLAVSGIALEHGANEDEAIAALLHDAVEDQGGLPILDVIRERFGDAVAEIVWGCTDSDVIPKPPWRQRKEAYVAHIASASYSIRLVSGSDKLHNARSILSDYRVMGDDLWHRFHGGRDGTLWYYRSLVNAFREAGDSRLVEELHLVVCELERLAGAAATHQGA
jgi:(p)ppGpp synthase/HD superfamily hydrolase